MRILFLTHRLPCPPDRGCKVRSAAILNWLAGHHEVWCAGFLDHGPSPELQAEAQRSLTALRQLCKGLFAVPFKSAPAGYRAAAGLMTGNTATEAYFTSKLMRQTVAAWSRQVRFDAVFAFSSGMAPLAIQAAAPRRVLCMDDLDSRKWSDLAAHARRPMRWVYATEARRLAEREKEWLARFDATLMVSQREADLVSDPALRGKVHVIPPILPEPPPAENLNIPLEATGPVVGFVGAMDYEPNIDAACWFAREIWPQIRRRRGEAKLMIVGRSATPEVRELARDASILVTGTVPEVNRYFSAMRVHVAPLRISRGVQIKVLAAMAMGRPCVVTSSVARGLGAQSGHEVIVADTPAEFAAAVADLLEDLDRAQAVARAGKRFVDRLNPEQVMRRIERLLSGEPGHAVEWEEPEFQQPGTPARELLCR